MKAALALPWLTAADIAELALPGLPDSKRAVNARAQAEGWAEQTTDEGEPLVRARSGRGGGHEYHPSLLPIEAQEAIIRGVANNGAQINVCESKRAEISQRWEWFEKQSASVKERAEERTSILAQIDALVAAGISKTAAIKEVGKCQSASRSAIASWFSLVKAVDPANRLPYLAPQYRGGGQKADLDEELWQALKSDYLRPACPSWTTCYRRTKRMAKERGLSLPTEKTLWRRFKQEVPREVVTLKRKGTDALRQTLPPQQRSVADLHAMELINIDGHRCNVRVELPNGKIIRPTMIAIQDVYSRKYLAWRFAPTEDAITARLCFADLFAKFGIPKGLLSDNGRAFAAKWLTGGAPTRFRFKVRDEDPVGLLTMLGIKIHWAKPYRGQSKPIERGFRDFCDAIAKHPAFEGAYTGSNALDKPDNYGAKAVPWAKFEAIWNAEIHEHNAQAGRRTEMAQGGLSFDQVFDASYATAPIGKAAPEQLRLALFAAEQVLANRKDGSIKLLGNRYWTHELAQHAGERLTVRFDPENAHAPVHVYTAKGKFVATADMWEASGFLDAEAAKRRSKLEADHRKAAKQAAEALDLLTADQVAAMLPGYDGDPAPVSPVVVRPVRPTGAVAAALKPIPQAEDDPEPAETDFLDAFTAGTARLRVVE